VTADERRFAPVTRTDLVRYAGASGDFHPLRHDEQFCRAAGFPSPFAMGMYSAGLIGSWAADRVAPEAIPTVSGSGSNSRCGRAMNWSCQEAVSPVRTRSRSPAQGPTAWS
jgi:MaoC like domain